MRPVIVVMGVSGAGKSTVGRLVAERLGRPFIEADDFHRPQDLERMAGGEPLTDAERGPWIARLNAALHASLDAKQQPVLACSALHDRHRRALVEGLSPVSWVLLTAPADKLRRRLVTRSQAEGGVGPSLLNSQLAEMDPPPDALVIDASGPSGAVADACISALQETGGG